MIQTSPEINEIATALAKAQAEMENVAKDRENPHFKSRYATLGGVLDEVRPKLAKHGISVVQMPVNGEGASVGVVTRLLHSSGQWIESAFFVMPTKQDAQGAGSALTYCRRYSLMAAAGVGPEDDDGEAAVARPQPQAPRAGMVRAADVPPQKANGNGGIAGKPPVEHPKRQEALDAYTHIAKSLKEAKTPAAIEELIKINAKDLALVKEVHAESYETLMRSANNYKALFYGETG